MHTLKVLNFLFPARMKKKMTLTLQHIKEKSRLHIKFFRLAISYQGMLMQCNRIIKKSSKEKSTATAKCILYCTCRYTVNFDGAQTTHRQRKDSFQKQKKKARIRGKKNKEPRQCYSR